ncbi:MAG: DUF2917 domain-containing protein [Hydrogenophaga sp.]|nr:DUF2917 domain-containing protein [Hydrogenophaga sp.]
MSPASFAPVSSFRLAGSWRLHPGHAMSLMPRQASWLRVHRGRVWVTFGEPSALSPEASGDRFLDAGEALLVPAGARLVMEPMAAPGDEKAVCFDWTEVVAPARVSDRFQREVATPAWELVSALGQAALAAGRVLRGVFGYGEFLVAGRGRVLTPLESMRS